MPKGSAHSTIDTLTIKRIRLGVTGFSLSGKTVFICSLVQALLTSDSWKKRPSQGPLQHFRPLHTGKLHAAKLVSGESSTIPEFPFRQVRDSLLGDRVRWPAPTEGIARLRLSLEVNNTSGIAGRLRNKIGLHRQIMLEIVDFPGEWLVDLPMLAEDFTTWSAKMLTLASRSSRRHHASAYLQQLDGIDTELTDPHLAERLSDSWSNYLQAAFAAGLPLNQPGRHLRPDTLRHSPLLHFSPLPDRLAHTPVYDQMRDRFKQYQSKVIKPFYKETFAKMDRQVVLVDLLNALVTGQEAFDEMTEALGEALGSFRYGKGGLLSWLSGRSTTNVLFAATKADHVVRADRANLEAMLGDLLHYVDDANVLRASAAKVEVMALASVMATEDVRTVKPPHREVLQGRPKGEETLLTLDPGGIPLSIPPNWQALDFDYHRFEPPENRRALQEGFTAYNLGRALEFLIGEDFE